MGAVGLGARISSDIERLEINILNLAQKGDLRIGIAIGAGDAGEVVIYLSVVMS